MNDIRKIDDFTAEVTTPVPTPPPIVRHYSIDQCDILDQGFAHQIESLNKQRENIQAIRASLVTAGLRSRSGNDAPLDNNES